MAKLQTIIVLLGLGLDNLLLSAALGASGISKRLRISLIFALFEGLMPLLGFLLGRFAGTFLGAAAFVVGLLAMAGLGGYMLLEDDDEEEALGALRGKRLGWGFVGAALGISADEGAAGLSFGLLEFPVVFTVLFLTVQAFVFSLVGLALGAKLRPVFRGRAEKAVGLLLIGMALWLAAERWLA